MIIMIIMIIVMIMIMMIIMTMMLISVSDAFLKPLHTPNRVNKQIIRGIPENHDIRENWTFEKFVGTRKCWKIMISGKTNI